MTAVMESIRHGIDILAGKLMKDPAPHSHLPIQFEDGGNRPYLLRRPISDSELNRLESTFQKTGPGLYLSGDTIIRVDPDQHIRSMMSAEFRARSTKEIEEAFEMVYGRRN